MRHSFRLATPADGPALLALYAPYVRDTAITFETEVPGAEVFSQRIAAVGAQYPYLICELGGTPVGYAYASRHRERDAYRYDVDLSIYLHPAQHGSGIAAALYDRLFALLRAQGYRNTYAACTLPNEKSVRFHEKCGFTAVGVHHNTGYKLGAWRDVLWLEKQLAAYDAVPGQVLPIGALDARRVAEALSAQDAEATIEPEQR